MLSSGECSDTVSSHQYYHRFPLCHPPYLHVLQRPGEQAVQDVANGHPGFGLLVSSIR
jgi:hypothetical protein